MIHNLSIIYSGKFDLFLKEIYKFPELIKAIFSDSYEFKVTQEFMYT